MGTQARDQRFYTSSWQATKLSWMKWSFKGKDLPTKVLKATLSEIHRFLAACTRPAHSTSFPCWNCGNTSALSWDPFVSQKFRLANLETHWLTPTPLAPKKTKPDVVVPAHKITRTPHGHHLPALSMPATWMMSHPFPAKLPHLAEICS